MRARPDNADPCDDRQSTDQHGANVLPFITRAELNERAMRPKRQRWSLSPRDFDDDDPGPPAA